MSNVEAGATGEADLAAAQGVRRDTGATASAIGMACAAVFLYSIMDALIKHLGQRGYSPIQLLFLRCLVGMVPVAIMAHRAGGWATIKSRRPVLLFVRALLGMGSLFAFFTAFQMIPLAEAVAIGFAAPFIVTALSAPILREQVGFHRWAAVIVGFAGVVIIARPGQEGVQHAGALMALLGAALYAVGILLNRRFLSESNLSVVFFSTFYGLIVSGMLLLPGRLPPVELPLDLLFIALLGLVSVMGLLLLTKAYRNAPASVLAPFDYTGILYATVLGYIFFGETLNASLVIGTILIIGGALYVLYRETRQE